MMPQGYCKAVKTLHTLCITQMNTTYVCAQPKVNFVP